MAAGCGFVEGCIAGSIGVSCVDIVGDAGISIGTGISTGPGLQEGLDTVDFTVAS